ncbi:MAG: CpaF family protein [Candidatus Nanohaloarchaeota archaeon]|nr:CpaF family protein [Candidatus Nanohaloarchaeota archaeon]
MVNEQKESSSLISYNPQTNTIIIDCSKHLYPASLEDYEIWMSLAIDALIQYPKATTLVLRQSRDFIYDYEQVSMLKEIARILHKFVRVERIISLDKVTPFPDEKVESRIAFLQKLLLSDLRKDPIGAYVELNREIIRQKALLEATKSDRMKKSIAHYLNNALLPLKQALESTQLISLVKDRLVGYKVGDRSLYREIFHPVIRPNFMLTKYSILPPQNADKVTEYEIEDAKIEIYKLKDKALYYYHLIPAEFSLNEKLYEILDIARRYLSEHKPKKSDFAEPERMREVFYNIGKDLVLEIAERTGYKLSGDELNLLAKILVRYTAGYGIIELFLQDENIQDFYVNAPVGKNPVFVNHAVYGECETNIVPTYEDAEAWATRFRIESGRPLDESSPVLDTEIEVRGARARIAAITRNLSPDGLAFAFRRHRDRPWTLPLFIKYRMLNPLAAGLISFIVDGARTLLVAGTRGTGKSSLLGSIIAEIMRKYRIVSVEDTLELPMEYYINLGYNIERLKARSALSQAQNEMPADEAIRTSLRLGDSCLIIGEVRSVEAKALYESMRIGALANVVAGTIHGDSPYGVFDRVVNDLGVPKTSFKATDIIIIANKIKSADGMSMFRRVIEITEVRKEWDEDPLKEKGFVKLMDYNAKKDELEPTETLLNGESFILNEIAKRVKQFHNDWEKVWDNILLRAKMKSYLVEMSNKINNTEILEADFVVASNEKFHVFTEEVMEEHGELDYQRVYNLWKEWVDKEVRLRWS